MDHSYKDSWKSILAAPDQKEALSRHFNFFSQQPAIRKIVIELFQKTTLAQIQDDPFVIGFEGGVQLSCSAPAEVIQQSIPESYARVAEAHNFIELKTPFDVPFTFPGVDKQGELYGAEFLEEIRESDFYADLTHPEQEEKEIFQALMVEQDEVIFSGAEQGANGEPALFYVGHEDGEPKGPIVPNLCFSEIFLLFLAEKVLDRPLFDDFKIPETEVRIGSESFPLNTKEIDLFQEDLGFLPPEIGLLTRLKSISLCQCKIKGLPAEIGNLTALEELNLMANELEGLPEEIGNLECLRELQLAENKIKTIPSSIGKLKALKLLDLGKNSLEVLPDSIGKLKKLEKLRLEGEGLSDLPAGFSALSGLKELWISRCGFTSLPESIGTLTNLERLFLIENRNLKELPENISSLENLKELYLNFCSGLSSLPAGIQHLEKLTTFSALRTGIDTQSFAHVCGIRSLSSIEITWADITQIPAAIGNLCSLEKLNLEGNPIIEVAPEIGALKKLTALDLDGCKLKSIPPELGELEILESLSLTTEGVEEIPETLSQLSHLRFLSLKNIALAEFPDFLFQLPKLSTLSLKEWQKLSGIGDEIARCPSLTKLWVLGCPNFGYLSEKVSENEQFKSFILRKGQNADKILETISRTPNVIEVEIEGTDLTSLPESIGKMTLLAKLELPDNKITHIPGSIANMKKLWSLNLAGNNLTEIIPEVFKIEKLHTLNLSSNPISTLPDEIQMAKNLRKLWLNKCDKISGKELERIKKLVRSSN